MVDTGKRVWEIISPVSGVVVAMNGSPNFLVSSKKEKGQLGQHLLALLTVVAGLHQLNLEVKRIK